MTRQPPASSDAAWTERDLGENPHTATDKAERVCRMFAAIAGSYDLNNRVHSFGRDQAWRRKAVQLAEIRPGDDVLDVACGTGDLTEAFAVAGPASVTGLDFVDAMLEIARRKSARRSRGPGAPRPTYTKGDAQALPFADVSFDVVSIAFGIRNVADPAEALREFRRVLRPRGRLVILEFDQPTNPLIRWCNRLYCERIMPRTATLLAGDRSGAYRYLPRSVATFRNRDELRALVETAGFEPVAQFPLTFGVCVATVGRVPRSDPVASNARDKAPTVTDHGD